MDYTDEAKALLDIALEYTPKLRKLGVAKIDVLGGRLSIELGPDTTEPTPPVEVKRAPTTPPGRGHALDRAESFGRRAAGAPTFKRDPVASDNDEPTPENE